MATLQEQIQSIEKARSNFILSASDLSTPQTNFHPKPEAWSICQIVEHIVWAERVGVMGIWKALEGIKNQKPIWEGTNLNADKSLEALIAETWQRKEKVPDIARPIWGGALDFWLASLRACTAPLAELGNHLNGMDLKEIVYPHPISGPMHASQRLDFLRFHLNRHQAQIEQVKAHPDFPI